MSGQSEVEARISLEDLFLSREFGRTLPPERSPELDDAFLRDFWLTLEGGTDDVRMRMTPLRSVRIPAAGTMAMGAAWRTSATRNRAMAVASGVAAAALVVAGFASGGSTRAATGVSAQGPTTPTGAGGNSSARPSPTTEGPAGVRPVSAPASVVAATGSAGLPVSAAAPAGTPGRSVAVEVPPGTIVTVVSAEPPASSPRPPSAPPANGGSPAPAPLPAPDPAPAPTGTANPLAPVVSAVSTTETGVGNTVSSAGAGFETEVPTLAPLTTVVANLGSTVGAAAPA